MSAESTSSPRRQRSDGRRSRAAILEGATSLATVEGLDGLSIGRLSSAIGMSKSGLYAHFGSKQELQLATVGAAEEVFDREVIEPALAAEPGVDRVRALAEHFFTYLRMYPGGCFFATTGAELAARKGPVRERIRTFTRRFMAVIEGELAVARDCGQIGRDADPAQLAFELDALMLGANSAYALFGDPEPIERARVAIERTLERA